MSFTYIQYCTGIWLFHELINAETSVIVHIISVFAVYWNMLYIVSLLYTGIWYVYMVIL